MQCQVNSIRFRHQNLAYAERSLIMMLHECFQRYWNSASRTPRCPLNPSGGGGRGGGSIRDFTVYPMHDSVIHFPLMRSVLSNLRPCSFSQSREIICLVGILANSSYYVECTILYLSPYSNTISSDYFAVLIWPKIIE